MDWSVVLATAGSIASIAGLLGCAVQTLRYNEVKRKNRELLRIQNSRIWGNIALALQAFERLEPLREEAAYESLPPDVRVRVIAARQAVVDQYLRLLEQASLDELEFTHETVEQWKKSGRLENDWRVDQARRLVPTTNFEDRD